MFKQFDVDDSGALDKHELRQMLRQLGIGESMNMVRKLLDIYDADGSGTVEEDEFISFLNGIHEGEVKARQYEGMHRFLSVKGASKAEPYIPPSTGTMRCQVDVLTMQANFIEAVSEERLDSLLSLSKNSNEGDAIIDFALSTIKLKHEEAQKLFNIMVKQTADHMASLIKIVPRMLNPSEARIFINNACTDDISPRVGLRSKLGGLLRVVLGRPNGYYQLSIRNENDRDCLERLVQLSNGMAGQRKKTDLGDTSQMSDYSAFRNVKLDGAEYFLDCERFSLAGLPKNGNMEFDFALFSQRTENNRPRDAMSDTRLFNTMCGLGLLESKKKMMVLNNINFLNAEVKDAVSLQRQNKGKWSRDYANDVWDAWDELSVPEVELSKEEKKVEMKTLKPQNPSFLSYGQVLTQITPCHTTPYP